MDKKARIYIAGHLGLVGSAILDRLKEEGYNNFILKTHQELDLINQQATEKFFKEYRPEYVFLAAAKVGGIFANNIEKADFIYQNLEVQNNVIYNSAKYKVKKLLFLGSSCIYPRLSPQPIKEEYFLSGKLEPTNDAYAIAKIAGIVMCQSFNKQYKTNFICVMPTNLYGPNDNFDLKEAHVIPGMMRRFYEAKISGNKEIVLWGSGKVYREFLHVNDLARACIFLMKKYNQSEIINIGFGHDLTLRQLALLIKKTVGFKGKIVWDRSKPDGMPRKYLDSSVLRKMGWRPHITLSEGLKDEYRWLVKNYDRIVSNEKNH